MKRRSSKNYSQKWHKRNEPNMKRGMWTGGDEGTDGRQTAANGHQNSSDDGEDEATSQTI